MNYPIKIAQVIGRSGVGGVERLIMNYCSHMDKELFQFDFFVENESKIINYDSIKKINGRLFFVPHYSNIKKY